MVVKDKYENDVGCCEINVGIIPCRYPNQEPQQESC